MSDFLFTVYNPLPIRMVRGEDVWLYDDAGKRYLDALGGIAVVALGHSHPQFRQAMHAQLDKLLHTANIVIVPQQEALGQRLVELSGLKRAFICSTGAEANECAIKLARLFGHEKNIDTPSIIVMDNAFHGRTLATLSASGSRKVQAGFEPLVQGFARAPYNDLQAIETIAANRHDIVAVMAEPIQGEAGVFVPDANYLRGIRELCDKHNWLMILDEIQSGMGRTGAWFCYQHFGIKPDVVTLAKALGNGIPVAACIAGPKASELMHVGNHGTTFGGNPFSCTAALTVLDIIEKDALLQNCAKMGELLKAKLTAALAKVPGVLAVRGLGLWLGIELKHPCRKVMHMAAEQGVIIGTAGTSVVRLAPPLICKEEHLDQIVSVLAKVIPQFLQEAEASA